MVNVWGGECLGGERLTIVFDKTLHVLHNKVTSVGKKTVDISGQNLHIARKWFRRLSMWDIHGEDSKFQLLPNHIAGKT